MSAASVLALTCLGAASAALVTGVASTVAWHTRNPVARRVESALRGLKPQPVDLVAYQGRWYEQRRLDSWFEKNVDNVTAQYVVRKNGMVSVTNTSVTKDGFVKVANGVARRTSIPGYLLVSFFAPVEGAYVVLDVDVGSHSVVGSPDRKFLWLLTRNKQVTQAQLDTFTRVAKANGYSDHTLAQLKVVHQDL